MNKKEPHWRRHDALAGWLIGNIVLSRRSGKIKDAGWNPPPRVKPNTGLLVALIIDRVYKRRLHRAFPFVTVSDVIKVYNGVTGAKNADANIGITLKYLVKDGYIEEISGRKVGEAEFRYVPTNRLKFLLRNLRRKIGLAEGQLNELVKVGKADLTEDE